jgi:hypothetical protein
VAPCSMGARGSLSPTSPGPPTVTARRSGLQARLPGPACPLTGTCPFQNPQTAGPSPRFALLLPSSWRRSLSRHCHGAAACRGALIMKANSRPGQVWSRRNRPAGEVGRCCRHLTPQRYTTTIYGKWEQKDENRNFKIRQESKVGHDLRFISPDATRDGGDSVWRLLEPGTDSESETRMIRPRCALRRGAACGLVQNTGFD